MNKEHCAICHLRCHCCAAFFFHTKYDLALKKKRLLITEITTYTGCVGPCPLPPAPLPFGLAGLPGGGCSPSGTEI